MISIVQGRLVPQELGNGNRAGCGVIVDGGESGKSLQRPGIERMIAMIDRREVQIVIIAKLDRLTRSVRDLGELLERFQRRGVALVRVSESRSIQAPLRGVWCST